MKHAQAIEFQGRATTARYLVIADFTPEDSCAAFLVHKLHVDGADVVISGATPFTSLPLVFRTRRLFAETRVALDDAISPDTRCVIYPSGLGVDQIDKPRWASRRMQEWRRYRLAIAAAWKSKHCTLMLERAPPLWLTGALVLTLLVLKPFGLHIKRARRHVSTASVANSVAALMGSPSAPHPGHFALRANATRLGKAGQQAPLAADLRMIYEVSIFLRRSGKTFLQTGHSSGVSKAHTANFIPAGAGISQFMQHYNATLPKPFPLRTPQDKKDFIAWYLQSPMTTELPVPLPIAADEFARKTGPVTHQAKAILALAHRVEDLSFLPDPVRAYFAGPMGANPENLSRMELLCAVLAGLKPANRTMFDAPWQSREIRYWYSNTLCRAAPAMQVFSTGKPAVVKIPQTVAIMGVIDGQSGLSRNAKMHCDAFAHVGRPLLRSVTMHNTNADNIPRQVVTTPSDLHIGFLLWELEKTPETHRLAGELLDEIWVPSSYVQSIYHAAYNREVVNMGKGIHLPKVGVADMSSYGITRKHHVVLTCFDAHSSVERKNPLAAVQAFQQAFASNPDARMFVKTTPTGKSHWGDPNQQMRQITVLADRDPRIIVETKILPFHDLLALINRADCVVSPHRAEGFGYIPAYALGYVTPVIATDYSGTTDICTPETAFPVKYAQREVKQGETIAPVKTTWADIDKDALAKTIREVFENPDLAHRKARAGQKLIKTRYSPAMQAKRYAERLKILGAI